MVGKLAVLGTLVTVLAVAVLLIGYSALRTASQAQDLALTLCSARNAGITNANARWALEREAWKTAAHARAVSAANETGTQRTTDLAASRTYTRVADAIVPYPTVDCGG